MKENKHKTSFKDKKERGYNKTDINKFGKDNIKPR